MSAVQLSLLAEQPGLPEGFRYRPELVSRDQERRLLARFPTLDLKEFEFHGFLGKRRVASFGLRYDFAEHALHKAPDIPGFLWPLRAKAAAFAGIAATELQHALVTEYAPGATIGWHRDRAVFDDVIGISFGSACRFRLRRRDPASPGGWQRAALILEPRSAYLLRGPVREKWEHSIPAAERLRYSVTFRRLRPGPASP